MIGIFSFCIIRCTAVLATSMKQAIFSMLNNLLPFRYTGYCPQAKFWHYADTFGNTTAKCFQERRTAGLNSSVMKQPGTSGDGKTEFPTIYTNKPNLVLAARATTRERWRNANKYSLFNEDERGREVKQFYQVRITSLMPNADWQNNIKSISILINVSGQLCPDSWLFRFVMFATTQKDFNRDRFQWFVSRTPFSCIHPRVT